jgi:hypothetical protein
VLVRFVRGKENIFGIVGFSKGNAVIKRILIDHTHTEVLHGSYRRGDAFFFVE